MSCNKYNKVGPYKLLIDVTKRQCLKCNAVLHLGLTAWFVVGGGFNSYPNPH